MALSTWAAPEMAIYTSRVTLLLSRLSAVPATAIQSCYERITQGSPAPGTRRNWLKIWRAFRRRRVTQFWENEIKSDYSSYCSWYYVFMIEGMHWPLMWHKSVRCIFHLSRHVPVGHRTRSKIQTFRARRGSQTSLWPKPNEQEGAWRHAGWTQHTHGIKAYEVAR